MCRKMNRFVAMSIAAASLVVSLVGCGGSMDLASGGFADPNSAGAYASYYDPNSAGNYGGYYGGSYSGGSASSGGGNWYNYGWNEYDGNGGSDSFSLNPGTNVHESVDNYLSSNITYP